MGLPPYPFPPQFPRDLRAAPTLPGLANPPLEGVCLARQSSAHRVKQSVCPQEPVHTSISDLLHSTANVKPHYPPLNGVPDPTFTSGHKAWSPGSLVVCRLTPGPLTFVRPKVTAQFFLICSDICWTKFNINCWAVEDTENWRLRTS